MCHFQKKKCLDNKAFVVHSFSVQLMFSSGVCFCVFLHFFESFKSSLTPFDASNWANLLTLLETRCILFACKFHVGERGKIMLLVCDLKVGY